MKDNSIKSDLGRILKIDALSKGDISDYLTMIYQASVRDIAAMNKFLTQLIVSSLIYFGLSEGIANQISILGLTLTYRDFLSCLFLIYYSYLISDFVRLLLHVRELQFMHNQLNKRLGDREGIHAMDEKLIAPQAGRYEEVNAMLFNKKNFASGLFFGISYTGLIVFFVYLFRAVYLFNPTSKIQLNLGLKSFSLVFAGLMVLGIFINIYNHYKLLQNK